MSLEKIVADLVEKVERRYYGKYRGFVVDNDDPEKLGRLTLQVPSLLGKNVVTGWALPCLPYGGSANQGMFFIPEKKAGVWVEFEEGDLEFPIWIGTFWSKPDGTSELPKHNNAEGNEDSDSNGSPTRKIIKTMAGHTIQFEDDEDKAMITIFEKTHQHVITLDDSGITISENGGKSKVVLADDKITVKSPSVTIESDSIKLGSGAADSIVLGDQFNTNFQNFLIALSTHTHTATSMGGPTTPPVSPFSLTVPLSKNHKVE